MNQHDRDEKLSLLLADVYQSDERALELLVKYASDPASLDAGERNEVEARLARDASWQDRLRVLQNFDSAMAFDDADALDVRERAFLKNMGTALPEEAYKERALYGAVFEARLFFCGVPSFFLGFLPCVSVCF